MSRTRVGIIGGAFSPPHNGHLELGQVVLQAGLVDEVWYLPCYHHAFEKELPDFNLRLKMCSLMVEGIKGFSVCDDEGIIKSKYSIEILEFITSKYNCSFNLILGSDNYFKLDKWREFDRINELAKPIWVNRAGDLRHIPFVNISTTKEISSTFIRDNVKDHSIVGDLLDPKVYDFIIEKGLYQ